MSDISHHLYSISPRPTHLISVCNICMFSFSRGQAAATFNVLRRAGPRIMMILVLLQMVMIMVVLLLLLVVVEVVHFLNMLEDRILPQLKAVALA